MMAEDHQSSQRIPSPLPPPIHRHSPIITEKVKRLQWVLSGAETYQKVLKDIQSIMRVFRENGIDAHEAMDRFSMSKETYEDCQKICLNSQLQVSNACSLLDNLATRTQL